MLKDCDVCGAEFETAFYMTPDGPKPARTAAHVRRKRCSAKCDTVAIRRVNAESRRRQSERAAEGFVSRLRAMGLGSATEP